MPKLSREEWIIKDIGQSLVFMSEDLQDISTELHQRSRDDFLEKPLLKMHALQVVLAHNIRKLEDATGQTDPYDDDMPF